MTGRDLLEGARVRVWNRHPYLSAVLMSLKVVEKPGIKTLAVDAGWRLYYDPEQCVEWGVDYLSAVVAHEVWHVLRDHFGRQKDRVDMVMNPETGFVASLWNLAGDLEINSDITKAGWKLPEGCLLPTKWKMEEGLLAEEYYAKLKEITEKNTEKMMGGKTGAGMGHCGSCAGHTHECEDGQGDKGKDDGKDGKGNKGDKDGKGQGAGDMPAPIPKWEQEILRRQVAHEVATAAKTQGNVPAGLKNWAEQELAPPKVDWRNQLKGLFRRAMTEAAGAVDSTYRKMSRRSAGLQAHFGVYRAPILPALHRPIPNVGLILDVSGSMMGGPAEAARAEIMGVVKAVGCALDVYVADTRVAGKQKVQSNKDVAKLGETLGGTDMQNAIMEVCSIKKYDIVVVLTDGYTGWHEPGSVKSRILAAVTPGGQVPPEHVPYVQIEDVAK